MIEVIQLFKAHQYIEKQDYAQQSRQLLDSWSMPFESASGYLKDQTLHLPLELKNGSIFKNADLIIIQDIKDFNSCFLNSVNRVHFLANNPRFASFMRPLRKYKFELFVFEKVEAGKLDLHLAYQTNQHFIGIPERQDHKLAELKPGFPLRYRLNGKLDFTMTGRKQRTYSEYDYVLMHLGKADTIIYEPLNKVTVQKEIPLQACKLIDERKILK